MLLMNPPQPRRCKHCRRPEGNHNATTRACPQGRSRTFPWWHQTQTFEPTTPRKKGP